MLGLNLVDLFTIGFLVIWTIHGFRRGFLVSFADLLVLVASIYFATKIYPALSMFANSSYKIPRSFSNISSFTFLFGLIHLLLSIIFIRLIYPPIKRFMVGLHLSKIDKIAGILPTAIGGIIWLSIILGILSWFPVNTYVKDLIAGSRIGAPIVKAASVVQPQAEKIVGNAIEDTIGFMTTRRGSDGEWKPNIPADTKTRFDPAAEIYMLSLINKEREVQDLQSVVPDLRLREVARAHSMDMVKNNFFDHKSPTAGYLDDRLMASGIFYLMAGENLSYAQDIDLAHIGLMESEGHRANILEPYHGKVGIGIINAGPYGYMCTQVFTD